MPSRRSCGGTKTPPAGSDRTCPSISITPPSGTSSPAMQRNVVVLPQPDGPSSVRNSFPASSNEMLLMTVSGPNDFRSPVTLIPIAFPSARARARHEPQEQRHDREHDQRRDQRERAGDAPVGLLEGFPDGDRQHGRRGAEQQDRRRDLAEEGHEQQEIAALQRRARQRQQDPAHALNLTCS